MKNPYCVPYSCLSEDELILVAHQTENELALAVLDFMDTALDGFNRDIYDNGYSQGYDAGYYDGESEAESRYNQRICALSSGILDILQDQVSGDVLDKVKSLIKIH